MSSEDEKYISMLTALFKQMGAEGTQAEVMARQLYKRSGQIAAERDISREQALKELLEKIKPEE